MLVTIEYLGHSGFILSDDMCSVAIDPFLTGNPRATRSPDSVTCDYIALTHGHSDHVGDTVSIAGRNDATVIAPFELCDWLAGQGVEKLERGNPGGRVATSFGWVAFTRAIHSSSCNGACMGVACGLVVRIADLVFYHAGDTDIFGDMKLIGEIYRPRIVALPIGDRYTMGAELASRAADLIDAPYVIPVHYATFAQLAQSTEGLTPLRAKVHTMQPGEVWTVEGRPVARSRF